MLIWMNNLFWQGVKMRLRWEELEGCEMLNSHPVTIPEITEEMILQRKREKEAASYIVESMGEICQVDESTN